jgi:hypothetical protein
MWPFKKTKPQDEKIKSAGNLQNLENPLSKYFEIAFKSRNDQKFNSKALLLMYETVADVNSIINYVGVKAGDIPCKHVKYLGNGKTKDLGETEVLKSIVSPNKGITQNQFISDVVIQMLVQGNTGILKKKVPGFVAPYSYEVLNSYSLYKIPQNSIDQYGTPSMNVANFDNPIVKYKYELENGNLSTIDLEDIIYIQDINPRKIGKDYYYGASKLYAATRSIKILSGLYDTINTILSAKGALGFIKRVSRPGEVDPMQWQEVVEEVERKINEDYGTTDNRRSIMATYADLQWQRMDAPVNDYLPIELSSQEFRKLCNQIGGMPDVLLNAKKPQHITTWKHQ